jgi:16S rRNA (guanine527-N7)-methyltransferase
MTPEAVAERFNVSRESFGRLHIYVRLLLAWQKKVNLIGPSTEPEIWTRHIADSLQLLALLPDNTNAIADLGSGAGLPGLVLAISGNISGHLIESQGKKAAFLREAIRHTEAPAQVHQKRIEAIAPSALEVQAITARALAPVNKLLELSAPFIAGGAIGLFHKGQDVDAELTEAAKYWTIRARKIPSLVDPRGVILEVEEAVRVGR